MHQVGNLFELNVKLRCQNVNAERPLSHYKLTGEELYRSSLFDT
jgi:hypothetical protein